MGLRPERHALVRREEFLDHGQWLHGRSVFDELIRIPLVVKFPGRRGAGQHVLAIVEQEQELSKLHDDQGALADLVRDLTRPKMPEGEE